MRTIGNYDQMRRENVADQTTYHDGCVQPAAPASAATVSATTGHTARRTGSRVVLLALCGLGLFAAGCSAPAPTPTATPRSSQADPDDPFAASPLFSGPAATQIASSPPVSAPVQAGPPAAPAPPTPQPTPTMMPGSEVPPSRRIRLRESVVARKEPRANAPESPLGRVPARLLATALEVNGDFVRIQVASVSAWVPKATIEYLQ